MRVDVQVHRSLAVGGQPVALGGELREPSSRSAQDVRGAERVHGRGWAPRACGYSSGNASGRRNTVAASIVCRSARPTSGSDVSDLSTPPPRERRRALSGGQQVAMWPAVAPSSTGAEIHDKGDDGIVIPGGLPAASFAAHSTRFQSP